MSNATLNASPSPATPQQAPDNDVAMSYARLLMSCYEIRKNDPDPVRLAELQTCLDFAERTLAELVEGGDAMSDVPNVPPPMPPAPGMPPGPPGGAPMPPGPGGPPGMSAMGPAGFGPGALGLAPRGSMAGPPTPALSPFGPLSGV